MLVEIVNNVDVDVPLNITLDMAKLLDTRLVDDVTAIGAVIKLLLNMVDVIIDPVKVFSMITTVLVGATNDVSLLSDIMGVCSLLGSTLMEVTDGVEVIVPLDIAVIDITVIPESCSVTVVL